jgi:hypothetical protein
VLQVLCADQLARAFPYLADRSADQVAKWDELLEFDEIFDDAHRALCEALADFSRSRGRAAVAKYLAATPRLLAKETAANLAAMPDLEQLEAALDARLPRQPTPGNSSTNTPASSESSPTA